MAWTLILEGVDPRNFNVVASFTAEMLMLSAAYSLSQLYAVLLSRYLRQGNTVHLQSLGRIPSDFLEATTVAQQTRYAWPAVLIAFLFFSDYFTAIAFAGLDFTYVDSLGKPEPVLNLNRQNPDFIYGVLGEPAENPRTHSKFEAILSGEIGSNTVSDEEMTYLAKTETIVHSFLSAADSLARAESPFLKHGPSIVDDLHLLTIGHQSDTESLPQDLQNLDATFVYSKDSFLTAIDKAIPLECVDEPLQFTQQIGSDFNVEATIPNCRYAAPRESGLFGVPEQAMVTAYAHFDADSVAIHSSARPNRPLTDNFSIPPNGRRLARDHVDVREGRLVYGFSGATAGSLRLHFGLAAMASGRAIQPTVKDLQNTNSVSDLFKREYAMTAQVQNCPSDPSGNTESSCFAVVSMECNDFGLLNTVNDWASTVFESTQCKLNSVEVVWMQNVVLNDAFLTSLSGVYGRNLKWTATSVQKKRLLAIHAAPSAMFALASLDLMESVQPVKSTTIDLIFILFMMLPVLVCFVSSIVSLVERKRVIPLPDDGMKMLILGKEFAKVKADPKDTVPIGISPLKLADDDDIVLETETEHGAVDDSEHKDGSSQELVKSAEVAYPPVVQPDYKQDLEVGSSKIGAGELYIDDEGEDDEDDDLNWINIGELHYDEHPLALCALKEHTEATDDDKETRAPGFRLKELAPKDTKSGKKEGFFSWFRPSGAGLQEIQTEVGTAGAKSGGLNMSNPVAGVFSQADKGVHASALTAGQGAAWHSAGTMAAVYTTSSSLVFSAAAVTAGSIVLAANSELYSSNNSTITRTTANFSAVPVLVEIPEGCFKNGMELGASVDTYFDGDNTTKTALLDDRGSIEDWCVDFVNDFSFLFVRKSGLKELNLSDWNVSSGKDFSFCFFEADALPIGIDQWDISGATMLTGMLSNVGDFNNNTLSLWNTSGVTDLSYLLASDAYSSSGSRSNQDDPRRRNREVDLRDDIRAPQAQEGLTPYVQDNGEEEDKRERQKYNRRAKGQKSRRFLDEASQARRRVKGEAAFIGDWDVSSVKNFQGVFFEYSGTTLDLRNWNTSSAEDMSYIFYDISVQELDVSTWDVSGVTTFAHAFSFFGGNSDDDMKFPDLSSWRTSSAQDMTSMFEFCQFHTNETDFTDWDVRNVVSFENMFLSNFDFQGEGLRNWDVSKAENFGGMFKNTNITEDFSSWQTGSATNFEEMFFGAQFFNSSLDLWDVGKVRDFSGMFYDNTIFESDLSQWKVKAHSIDSMFAFCTKFDSDLSLWDMSAVTDFSAVFRGATSFNSPLNSWKVSQGEDFSEMFRQAISFNQTLQDWNVEKGVDFLLMFYEAESFSGFGLESWQPSSALSMFQMFELAYDFEANLCSWWDSLPEDVSLFNLPNFFETGCDFQGLTNTGRGLYMCHRCFETVSPTAQPTSSPTGTPTFAPSSMPSDSPTEMTILAMAADFTNKKLAVVGSDQKTGSVNWNSEDFPEFTQLGEMRQYTFSLPVQGAYKFEAVNFNDEETGLGGVGEIILQANSVEFYRVNIESYGPDPVHTFEFTLPVPGVDRPNQQPVSPPVGEPFRQLNFQGSK